MLDDSMLKHLNSWKMLTKVNSDDKIFVKHFSGTVAGCMKEHKAILVKNQNNKIHHIRTMELILGRTLQDISTSIVNLTYSMKIKKCDTSKQYS